MTDRPNILLLVTDQQRFDTVGANGAAICQTPNLDRLAAGGVTFTKAYTPISLCSPARASLFTGVLPHRHGITRNTGVLPPAARALPRRFPTIAERLRGVGYACFLEGKWHVGTRSAMDCGFDGPDHPGYGSPMASETYREYLARFGLNQPEVTPLGVGWRHNFALAGKLSGPVEASVPAYLAQRTIDRLEACSKTDQPFLIATCFWGPHAPYLPSEPFASQYDPDTIPPWGNFEDDFTDKPSLYRRYQEAFLGTGGEKRSWRECALWAALYFGFVSQIDAQIGRILQALDSLGLADNTLVVFTTDHGDLTGAHGGLHDKSAMMVEELYHVPLVVRWPDGRHAGERNSSLTSTIDVPATALAAAGAPTNGLDGFVLGEAKRDTLVSATWGNHFGYESRMITDGRWKYIFHPADRDELYDLETDPWEMTNRADDPAADVKLAALRGALIDWTAEHEDPLWDPLVNLYGDRSQCGLANAQPYRHRSYTASASE